MEKYFREDVFENFLNSQKENYNKSLGLFHSISLVKKSLPEKIPLFVLQEQSITLFPNIKLPTNSFLDEKIKEVVLNDLKNSIELEVKKPVGKYKWKNFEKAISKTRTITLSKFLSEQLNNIELKDHVIRDLSYIIPISASCPELKYAALPEEYNRIWAENYGTCFKTIPETDHAILKNRNPKDLSYAQYFALKGYSSTDFFAKSPQFLGVCVENETTKKPTARSILYRAGSDGPFTHHGYVRSVSVAEATRLSAALLKSNYIHCNGLGQFVINVPFQLPLLQYEQNLFAFAFPTCNELRMPVSIEIDHEKNIATVGKPGIQTYTTYHYNGWFIVRK